MGIFFNIRAASMSTSTSSGPREAQLRDWKEIVDISNEILNLAQRNDWGQVDSLSLKREAMLERFFAQAIESEVVESIQKGIDEIRVKDEEVVRLVKKNRALLADEISGLQAKKKHIQDYLSNSR
jgi:hypothetical protein